MRQISTRFLHFLVPAAALLATACEKDPTSLDDPTTSRMLHFDVSLTEGWNTPQSRTAEAEDGTESVLPRTVTLGGDVPSDSLCMYALTSDGHGQAAPATRGAAVDDYSLFSTYYRTFGVTAFAYTGAWSEDPRPDYMFREEVSSTDLTTSRSWPGANYKMQFFAVAPYEAEGVEHSARTQGGSPTLRYRVPATATEQQDLLVAATGELAGNGATYGGTVPLQFRHLLTAIRFVTGDVLPGRITQIAITGVYGTALYTMATETWSDWSGVSDFTHTSDAGIEVDGSEDQALTGGSWDERSLFFMIPQTLPEGASIRIEYTDDLTGTPRTLTGSIGGSVWPAGKTVTYMISTSSIVAEPVFEVSLQSYEFNYKSFNADEVTTLYSLKSYITVSSSDGTKILKPLDWTEEFSTDGGQTWTAEHPEWFTLTPHALQSSGTHYSWATCPNQTLVPSIHVANEALQAAAPVFDRDLSDIGGSVNTANCYLVNAPGTYSLPLVYGNAITNGATNESAYTSHAQADGDDWVPLNRFINHLGNPITDPYIYNNAGCVPADATLLWQDEPNLVTNVSLTAEKQRLTFAVGAETIKEGNAVVAVRDAAGTIMWSWHIWITPYPLDVKIKYHFKSEISHRFMPMNIGWCEGELTNYAAPRSVQVRYTQNGTGITQVVTFTQEGHQECPYNNSTLFQFGRKDPMLPVLSDGNGNVYDKIWYDASGTASTEWPEGVLLADYSADDFIKTCIQNPMIGACSEKKSMSDSKMDGKYCNLWSAESTGLGSGGDPVVKTVYDPSPVGFHLPAPNDFRCFTDTEKNHMGQSGSSVISGNTDEASMGLYMKCTDVDGRRSYMFMPYGSVGRIPPTMTSLAGNAALRTPYGMAVMNSASRCSNGLMIGPYTVMYTPAMHGGANAVPIRPVQD